MDVSRSGNPPHPPVHIAVVSFTILALELALIRQIPAEVKAISYFTNLILISSFLGLGVGCILQQQRDLRWLVPLGVGLVFAFTYLARGVVIYEGSAQVHYWLQDAAVSGKAMQIPLFAAALAAFVASALPFVGLGQLLARRMDEHPRLVAYSWDIGGSLAGTAAFAACSFWHCPPWIWPPVLMLMWAIWFAGDVPARLAGVAAGGLFLLFSQSPLDSQWSPYYLVQNEPVETPRGDGQAAELGLRVYVNSSFHQFAIDFRDPSGPPDQSIAARMLQKFSHPYERYRQTHHGASPARVLVLGAGTGNDVNVALHNGATRIVAVEIDPVIYSLGKTLNRTRPYDDPRVEVHIDDARHYLRNCTEEFDLVVFATLDSQTLLSGVANLRLENYVYTVEALREARELLADDGLVGLYYSVMKPWLLGRIFSTVHEAFGDRLELVRFHDQFLFNTIVVASRSDLPEFGGDQQQIDDLGGFHTNRDDWPYLYLERPTIATVYLQLFAAIGALIVAVLWLLRTIHPVTGLHANYLFLGMGFTLLESAAIVRLALVFGSTWVVNAVVFSAALLTILMANLLVLKNRAPSLAMAWCGVLGALLVNYLLPVQALLDYETVTRIALAVVLIGSPIFFAAVCFSRLFEREQVTGYPLGINLVGAMSGALLEYLSMLIGMRDVWLVLVTVYLLAWLASWRAGQTQPGTSSGH
jgi:hypothetical protein